MEYRKVFRCDICGREFNDPYHSEEISSVFNFTISSPGESTGPKKITIGKNGEEQCLCEECTNKLIKCMKEMGYKEMYNGCSDIKI